MFNVPSFPTDSLYKFGFIFGVVLFIYSVIYQNQNLDRYNRRQNIYLIDSLTALLNGENQLDIKNLKCPGLSSYFFAGGILKIEHTVENDLDSLEKIAKNSDYKIQKDTVWYVLSDIKMAASILKYPKSFPHDRLITLDNFKYANRDSLINEIHLLTDIQGQFSDLIASITKEIVVRTLQNEDYNWNYKFLKYTSLFFISISLVLWYLKIQKPQDELLKIQLEEARRKFKKDTP